MKELYILKAMLLINSNLSVIECVAAHSLFEKYNTTNELDVNDINPSYNHSSTYNKVRKSLFEQLKVIVGQ